MNRRTIYEVAAGHFVTKHEDALLLGPPGTGKSHLAQAIGRAVILQGHRVLYREAHALIEEIADATIDGTRKELMEELATVSLLIVDDLGMRKLPPTASEDLLELVMRRYERASTLFTVEAVPSDDVELAVGQAGPNTRHTAKVERWGGTQYSPRVALANVLRGDLHAGLSLRTLIRGILVAAGRGAAGQTACGPTDGHNYGTEVSAPVNSTPRMNSRFSSLRVELGSSFTRFSRSLRPSSVKSDLLRSRTMFDD